MARTAEEWHRILDGLYPQDAAARILADLTAYPMSGTKAFEAHHQDDVEQLAAALAAYQIIE